MAKFTFDERTIVKSIIANLSLRRILDDEIIKEIERQTSKIISRQSLYNLRQQIKKESYDWYKSLWEGQQQQNQSQVSLSSLSHNKEINHHQ
jgi:hypothetical protein